MADGPRVRVIGGDTEEIATKVSSLHRERAESKLLSRTMALLLGVDPPARPPHRDDFPDIETENPYDFD
jgi:hypothetical protein